MLYGGFIYKHFFETHIFLFNIWRTEYSFFFLSTPSPFLSRSFHFSLFCGVFLSLVLPFFRVSVFHLSRRLISRSLRLFLPVLLLFFLNKALLQPLTDYCSTMRDCCCYLACQKTKTINRLWQSAALPAPEAPVKHLTCYHSDLTSCVMNAYLCVTSSSFYRRHTSLISPSRQSHGPGETCNDLSVPWLYPVCSLSVPCLYPGCTLSVPCL